MGAQQSTSNVINDTVNKSISNVLVSSSSNCAQNNTLENTQIFKNITADEGCSLTFTNISQTAQQSPNFTCSSDSKNDSQLATQFKNDLQQEVDKKVSNFPIGYASDASTITNKLVNDITNNINISNVSSCVQDNILKQKQEFDSIKGSCPSYCKPNSQMCVDLAKVSPTLAGSICDMSKCNVEFNDITQSAVQNAVGNCLSSNANYQSILGEASTELSQVSKSENTGVDLGGIVESIGSASSSVLTASFLPLIVIGIVVILVIGIGAYFLLTSGGSGNSVNYKNGQFRVGPSSLPSNQLQNLLPPTLPMSLPPA